MSAHAEVTMIQFNSDTLRIPNVSLSREWLETNGLGGFASSNIVGLNTRRYHGLLTAATKPPVGRMVLLSKLEEALVIDGKRYELSANQYPGTVHPQGFQFQTGFRLDPFPIFTCAVEGIEIEKSLFMVQGENTTVVQYDLRQPSQAQADSLRYQFELRPLIAFRDYHSTTHENSSLNSHVEIENGLVSVAPYADLPTLYVAHDAGEIDIHGDWYRNFEYRVEQERGLDFREDLFSPFAFIFTVDAARLKKGVRISLIASTERRNAKQADAYCAAEIKRRKTLAQSAPRDNDLVSSLTAAADQFIVARERCKTVIAGYHWFADWGRDTMIALTGLTLTTGRTEIAKSILAEFALHIDQGMLPNRFPDAGETPEYNTVDATLWFFEAVRALLQYTSDY